MNVCTYKIECRRICSVRVLKEESRYASVRNILQNGLLRGGITGDDNYLGESSILSICRFLENQNSTSSNNVLL
jgi:hypothetical protein